MEREASASADPSLPAGVHPPVGPRGHGPLVHVGYHKAASTWLQESVFCASDGAFAPIADIAASIDLLVRPHALEWSAEPVRTRLDGARAGAGAGARIPVLSNEEFSGNPHAGGFGSVEIAHRLAEVLPDARILVVVRRQPDAIVSTYKQFIRRGGTLSPRQYFDPDISHFRFRRFRPGHWEYDRLVSLYQRLFGEARVRVLPSSCSAPTTTRSSAKSPVSAASRPCVRPRVGARIPPCLRSRPPCSGVSTASSCATMSTPPHPSAAGASRDGCSRSIAPFSGGSPDQRSARSPRAWRSSARAASRRATRASR